MLSVSCSPLLESNDRPMGAVMVIKDITGLVDMENELKERLSQYYRKNQEDAGYLQIS